MFANAEIISTYTRSQAIEDGCLVDVTDTAREIGIKVHTAVTRDVWDDCVAWTEEDTDRQVPQDEMGRLCDVLYMFHIAAVRSSSASEIYYEIYRVPRGGKARKPRKTRLKAVIGPGDNMEPVITIMQPWED